MRPRLAVIPVDGVENLLLGREHRIDAKAGEGPNGAMVSKSSGSAMASVTAGILQGDGKTTELPQETRGQLFRFGRDGGRTVDSDQRHAKLLGRTRRARRGRRQKPPSMRILPIFSPRSFCSSSARSRSSAVTNCRSRSISPNFMLRTLEPLATMPDSLLRLRGQTSEPESESDEAFHSTFPTANKGWSPRGRSVQLRARLQDLAP